MKFWKASEFPIPQWQSKEMHLLRIKVVLKKIMKISFLQELKQTEREIGAVPSSEHKWALPVNYGFSLLFQVEGTLKEFWISNTRTTKERNRSLKNKENVQQSFDIVIFARNHENRLEKQKEVSIKRGIKKSICGRKIPYDHSSWDASLFCIRRIRRWYCHHLHMNEEAIQN